MSRSVHSCFVALAAVTAFALPARAADPLDPYLPKSGTIDGHLITFAVAPEDQAISHQFRQAVQDNMDWFRHAVQSNKPGQPLPYDKRMGITESQYEHLQHMRPQVQTGAAVTIAVERRSDGTIAFKPNDPASQALKDVAVTSGERVAETPAGQLTTLTPIHQTDANNPIGAWTGTEWARVAPANSDQPSAKLAFGKRDADGQGVLYYQVSPYKDHQEQSLVVFYKLD